MKQHLGQDKIFEDSGFRVIHDILHSITKGHMIDEDDLQVLIMKLNENNFVLKHKDEIQRYLAYRRVEYTEGRKVLEGDFLGFANEYAVVGGNAAPATQAMIERDDGSLIYKDPRSIKFLDE